MLLKNRKSTNNRNMVSQFNQFRQQLQASGQNPQDVLNELLASGKVNKQQLDKATQMAKMFSYLIK